MTRSRTARALARAALLAGLLAAGPARAIELDWAPVGDPGNACQEQSSGCYGGVAYDYEISTFEITNEQYAALLNAVAASDPNGLYHSSMSSSAHGGITRHGSSGSYTYSLKSDAADRPVVFVRWYSALRFANWLHNGQPTGAQDATTTEDGAYPFTGATAVGPRNPGAQIYLPNEDEWYKAAYYDPDADAWRAYPAGSNAAPKCSSPNGDDGNAANCAYVLDRLEDVGAYVLSDGPNGSYDQGGNAWEWTETATTGSNRVLRGGGWASPSSDLGAAKRGSTAANDAWADVGFRVAQRAPEPAGLEAAAAAAVALLARRRRGGATRRARPGSG